MNYQITDRIFNIMDSDKMCNPQTVCAVLEDEIKPIVENYICLNKDFKVRFRKNGDKNIFFIEFEADRIKPFGYIPK